MLLSNTICFWYAILYLIAPVVSSILFQSDSYSNIIRVSLIGLALSTISEPLLGYLRMEEKISQYVVITLVSSVFSIGISIWFVLIQGLGVNGFVMAGTLAQGFMLIFVWVVVGRKLHFQIEKNLLLPLIKIGFPSIFGLFAFLIIDYADRQMIQRMINLNALGVYSIGYSFGMVMSVVVGAFASAWPPFFMSYINKPQEARILFAKVLNFYLIFFGLFVVLFFFAAKPLLVLMTASDFHDAHLVVGLVAAGFMMKGCYLIFLPGIYFSGKVYKQPLVEWTAAFVNIGLNFYFIPLWGIAGAALATFLSYLTLAVVCWLTAKKYLAVDYDLSHILKIISVTATISGILYLLSVYIDVDLLMTIVIHLIPLFFYILIGCRFLMTPDDWKMLRSGL